MTRYIDLLSNCPGDQGLDLRIATAHLLEQVDRLLNIIDSNALGHVRFESKYTEHDGPEGALHDHEQVWEHSDNDRQCV